MIYHLKISADGLTANIFTSYINMASGRSYLSNYPGTLRTSNYQRITFNYYVLGSFYKINSFITSIKGSFILNSRFFEYQ